MAKKKQQASAKTSDQPAASSGNIAPWQRQVLIHLGILAAFYVVVVLYFQPLVFEGKVPDQHDLIQYKGMAAETEQFREETGEEALWVSTLFGGMPAFQTSVKHFGNWMVAINQFLWMGLPRPANYIFLMFAGFFFLMRVIKADPWVSAAGAAAFALSSYFFIILDVGHTSKANAIAYMAPLLGAVLLTYQGKYLLGGALTAFFTALEVSANHYQITYYLLLVFAAMGVFMLVEAIREKKVADFAIASAIVIGAGAIGVGPNIARLWTTYEYTAVTMRGESELTTPNKANQDGLDIGYAFRWSYGPSETLNLLIPNLYGGASAVAVDRDSDTYEEIRRVFGRTQQINQLLNNFPAYWGPQTGGTSGPVYVGAIVCFLFLFGLLVLKGSARWWLLGATLISFFLAWGRHMLWFNEFMFNYLPIYNKFRAPSMALVIAELTMPLLGFWGLAQMFNEEKTAENKAKYIRALYIAAGITGGIALLFALAGGGLLSFSRPDETRYGQLLDYLISYRQEIMRADALRSLGLIVVAAGLLWLYWQDRLKSGMVVALSLVGLILVDMIPINRRYLNDDSFVSDRRYEQNFDPSPADRYILQDQSPGYRVLNLTVSTFNDALTSYHHRSTGGYHPAKLRRYQDLIDRHLITEMQAFQQFLQSDQQQLTDSLLQDHLASLQVLNMLNTQYIIINPQGRPVQNLQAYGAAWYVRDIKFVNSPDEEIAALSGISPRRTAVVDQTYEDGAFATQLEGVDAAGGMGGQVVLQSFAPNALTYQTNSSAEGVVVFSEVYYNDGKGWQAYIDGEPVPHFRADYVLRGLVVPAGEHTVEFRFEPRAYFVGNQISMVFSIIVIGLMVVALVLGVLKARREGEHPS